MVNGRRRVVCCRGVGDNITPFGVVVLSACEEGMRAESIAHGGAAPRPVVAADVGAESEVVVDADVEGSVAVCVAVEFYLRNRAVGVGYVVCRQRNVIRPGDGIRHGGHVVNGRQCVLAVFQD